MTVLTGMNTHEFRQVGNGVQPLQFAVLALFALGGTALAVRLFRWE